MRDIVKGFEGSQGLPAGHAALHADLEAAASAQRQAAANAYAEKPQKTPALDDLNKTLGEIRSVLGDIEITLGSMDIDLFGGAGLRDEKNDERAYPTAKLP